MTKEIQLTQGVVALVDDEDFEFLSRWKWHAFRSTSGRVYAARNSETVNGRRRHIFMHRVIANTPDGMDTDHINGNSLDNRSANLRPVTRAQNMWNRAPNRNGASNRKGVCWHKASNKWVAAIQVNKRRRHLGLFASEEDAAAAYAEAARVYFGEFGRIA